MDLITKKMIAAVHMGLLLEKIPMLFPPFHISPVLVHWMTSGAVYFMLAVSVRAVFLVTPLLKLSARYSIASTPPLVV